MCLLGSARTQYSQGGTEEYFLFNFFLVLISPIRRETWRLISGCHTSVLLHCHLQGWIRQEVTNYRRHTTREMRSVSIIPVKQNTQNSFVFSLSDLSVVLLNLFLIPPTICEEEVIFGEDVPGDVYLKESIKSNVRMDSDDSLNVGLLWGGLQKISFSEKIFFQANI